MMTHQVSPAQVIADGFSMGYIIPHKESELWLEVKFPDGSWEVVPGTPTEDKHVAILIHAHRCWKDLAWRKYKSTYGRKDHDYPTDYD